MKGESCIIANRMYILCSRNLNTHNIAMTAHKWGIKNFNLI